MKTLNLKRILRRLAEIGACVGIWFICLPFLMAGFAGVEQWQLHREWKTARMAAVHTPHPRSDSHSQHVQHPNVERKGPIRLQIPRLGLDTIVVAGVSHKALAKGPGHFPSTAWPGEVGNCAIAAHRNMGGWWFARLNELNPGDQVILETPLNRYVYRVTGRHIVSPSNLDILRPHGHLREVTLITCTLPAVRRIVVHGILSRTSPADF